MNSQFREAFETLISEMEDPPEWGDLASAQTLSPPPRRTPLSGPMVAVAAAVLTVIVVGLVALIGSEGEPAGTIIGVWQFDGYTVEGQSQDVVADVNAAGEPWVTITAESMTGFAGCNAFTGPYQYENGKFTSDLIKDAAWCGPDDGTLMDAELAFEALVWHEGSVEVSFDGDRMAWSNDNVTLEFVSVESPPTTELVEPPPMSEIGQLDCSPAVVEEARVPDEGQEVLHIARDADSNVVEVEEWEPLRYSGLNAEGRVIVELALGDMVGAGYQVWTCSN